MASLFFAINDELGQRVEVNRRDLRVDETPLTLDMVRLLLDRGASCCAADFVFPSHDRFETTFEECHWQQLPKVKLAAGLLMVVEMLEDRGFQRADDHMLSDESFVAGARSYEVAPQLTLDDFCRLTAREATRRLAPVDCYNFATRYMDYIGLGLFKIHEYMADMCVHHMCQMLSREMFQRWAADSLYELMGRLPLHCCLSFATDESLTNEDLWRIYLANMDIIEEERFDDPMLECIFRPTGQLQY
ncbi:hypothetical protein TKK_0005685 [Trichogramma kaykai]